jgi:hypothetical protein
LLSFVATFWNTATEWPELASSLFCAVCSKSAVWLQFSTARFVSRKEHTLILRVEFCFEFCWRLVVHPQRNQIRASFYALWNRMRLATNLAHFVTAWLKQPGNILVRGEICLSTSNFLATHHDTVTQSEAVRQHPNSSNCVEANWLVWFRWWLQTNTVPWRRFSFTRWHNIGIVAVVSIQYDRFRGVALSLAVISDHQWLLQTKIRQRTQLLDLIYFILLHAAKFKITTKIPSTQYCLACMHCAENSSRRRTQSLNPTCCILLHCW